MMLAKVKVPFKITHFMILIGSIFSEKKDFVLDKNALLKHMRYFEVYCDDVSASFAVVNGADAFSVTELTQGGLGYLCPL